MDLKENAANIVILTNKNHRNNIKKLAFKAFYVYPKIYDIRSS